MEWAPRPTGATGAPRWHVHGHSLLNGYADGWSLRLAWAASQLDMRPRAGREALAELELLADAGRALYHARRDARRLGDDDAPHLAAAIDHGRRWAAACRRIGEDLFDQPERLPAIVDIREVNKNEGVKYASKAPHLALELDEDGRPTGGLTDAHLLELLEAVRAVRRVSAWGAVRDLGPEEPDKGDHDPTACPVCRVPSAIFEWTYAYRQVSRIPRTWELRELFAGRDYWLKRWTASLAPKKDRKGRILRKDGAPIIEEDTKAALMLCVYPEADTLRFGWVHASALEAPGLETIPYPWAGTKKQRRPDA